MQADRTKASSMKADASHQHCSGTTSTRCSLYDTEHNGLQVVGKDWEWERRCVMEQGNEGMADNHIQYR
jgi:hypothetical protein